LSKIEVDAVEPQSGTSLTLGASGDTITVPAGATFDSSAATNTLPSTVVTTTGTQTLTNKTIDATQLTDSTITLAKLSATGTQDATTFLRGDNTFASAGATAGQVIQVVQGTYATATTTTSASFVTTNIEASITPSSASNKVFVIATFFSSVPIANEGIYSIFRDSTNLVSTGDNALGQNYAGGSRVDYMSCLSFLDSPSTTSSTTYSVRFLAQTGTLTTTGENTTSVINLMEVKG
jgi:hypothetical protein